MNWFTSPDVRCSCDSRRTRWHGDSGDQTSDINPNVDIDDGLYPFFCQNNSSTQEVFFATDFVEVRMVFGAERDERFDWTTFYVAREEAAKADCRDSEWERFGFKNQGQCIRYLETGIDAR